MNNKVIINLMAILAFCGCQKKELIDYTYESKVFTATIEDGFTDSTKTTLDSGNVLWKKGDQVSIFAGNTKNLQYQVTDASDGKKEAEFKKVSASGFISTSEIDNNVSFYPYSSTVTIEKKSSNYELGGITLPATQTYAEESFGNGVFPMVAVTSSTTDMNLKFKNVLGGVKLQLKGSACITSIQITGNNDEILCGAASVIAAQGNIPTIKMTDATAKTMILDCGAGVQLNNTTATSFVIALPPMIMTRGFTVIVRDIEGKEMEIRTDKSQTITRSSILKMPVVNYEGTNEPLTFTSDESTTIALEKAGIPDDISLEYKLNDKAWTTYTIGTGIQLNDKDKVSFQADEGGNNNFSSSDGAYIFSVSGNGTVKASGNIMSLLDRTMTRNNVPSFGFLVLFYACEKLTDASKLSLPVITLAQGCYEGMFSGCTALTAAPSLPATNLAESCYDEMFSDCTALPNAPKLPATTLAVSCYDRMFSGCTSLTKAPELPAISLEKDCYYHMFNGCSSLMYVKALFTTTPSYQYTYEWLSGVSSTGTFVKSKDAIWNVIGANGIPSGWTVQTE